MKALLVITAVAALLAAISPASAFRLQNKDNGSDGCSEDAACNVFCDNGHFAGLMYWNGSVWTDGVKWDPDKNTEARKICDANGSDCK